MHYEDKSLTCHSYGAQTSFIMALIEMKDVTKKYHRSTTALRDINVSVNQGEFVYIVGPSGAGKSTFIKLLYREEKITSGSLHVGEFDLNKLKKREIPLLRRSVGVVFQDYKLLPRKTVFENVAYAMEVIGEKRRNIKKRVPLSVARYQISRLSPGLRYRRAARSGAHSASRKPISAAASSRSSSAQSGA